MHIPAYWRGSSTVYEVYKLVTEIGSAYDSGLSSGAFSNYSSNITITAVTFAAGSQLASIGNMAFYGCAGLTSITIPASVTTVGNAAFQGWAASQTIYIADYASQAAADAVWGAYWRNYCNSVIKYWNGSSWV